MTWSTVLVWILNFWSTIVNDLLKDHRRLIEINKFSIFQQMSYAISTNSNFVKKGHFSVPYFTWVGIAQVSSLIWWTTGFICPKINCKLNERIFIFTQNEKNCISPNVDVNPYFPQLSHPLESLSISLFNKKILSKNHKN